MAMETKWSNIQKECYARNCICRGCIYSQYNTTFKCRVKKSIIEEILRNGLKEGLETKKWLQE